MSNDAERVFIFTVHDLSTLLESKEVDLFSVVSSLRRHLHQSDPQVELVYSVLSSRIAEERYFNGNS